MHRLLRGVYPELVEWARNDVKGLTARELAHAWENRIVKPRRGMTSALRVAESHVRPFANESGVLGAEPLGVGVMEDPAIVATEIGDPGTSPG